MNQEETTLSVPDTPFHAITLLGLRFGSSVWKTQTVKSQAEFIISRVRERDIKLGTQLIGAINTLTASDNVTFQRTILTVLKSIQIPVALSLKCSSLSTTMSGAPNLDSTLAVLSDLGEVMSRFSHIERVAAQEGIRKYTSPTGVFDIIHDALFSPSGKFPQITDKSNKLYVASLATDESDMRMRNIRITLAFWNAIVQKDTTGYSTQSVTTLIENAAAEFQRKNDFAVIGDLGISTGEFADLMCEALAAHANGAQ